MHIRVERHRGSDRRRRPAARAARCCAWTAQAGKLVVEGVNRVYKHVRRSQKNPQGGRLSKEMPIARLATCCWSARRAARPTRDWAPGTCDDGSKERYCKKCGAGNGQIAPAKARYAKK